MQHDSMAGRYVEYFVPSEQQYIMYLDRTEDETGTAEEAPHSDQKASLL